MAVIHRDELIELCRSALLAAGAGARDARVLAEATAEAEVIGNRAVGVGHLFDYLDGYAQGRISKDAQPVVRRVAPAVLDADARSGLAQTAFADAFDGLLEATRESGLAALWIRNSFTCGELGYYARHLAAQDLVALAAANSPALMSIGGARRSVLGTNPLAYGLPRPGRAPVVIDQASSATAFVNVRRAAEAGEPIPAGWALDRGGEPTRDADAALDGTLLPFGGYRGGNVALLVEVLATLSGASFSLDAAPFHEGSSSPGIGVFVLGIDPATFPGSTERLAGQLDTLRAEHDVRLPALERTGPADRVELEAAVLQRLEDAGAADRAVASTQRIATDED
ncbi:Ldh family oxidoreductase [Pseudonocardia halophobica]|uniref:Malate dehydrogenase n=1 Tax=Pseudonocardia halophobica TaxID=29401 RepID=A0A9W6NUU6_9PSEU|nr:Ldh family oxidoreductase [Pseudonocardia halophobica]GLL09702.1 malate dehydrogenase [Pseudonocardia halophobica]